MAITKSNGAPPNELKVGMMVCYGVVSVVKEMKTSTEDIMGLFVYKFEVLYRGICCGKRRSLLYSTC